MRRSEKIYDTIVVGAGPGGIQAAIYLGRYCFDVLLLDRSGGRTAHAKHIENFLGYKAVTGRQLLGIGLQQARSFQVDIRRETVQRIARPSIYEVTTDKTVYRANTVVVSSGVRDNLMELENLRKFLGQGFYTCMDCDGYRTRDKKLLVVGNSIYAVRVALAMKKMYTSSVKLLMLTYDPPPDYMRELKEKDIALFRGRPRRLMGGETLEALEIDSGECINCECVMWNFGFKLNDRFLDGLSLKRDAKGFKYVTDHNFESSLPGLFIVGPLNTGNDQIVIAAGEGAAAAIEIKKRLIEI